MVESSKLDILAVLRPGEEAHGTHWVGPRVALGTEGSAKDVAAEFCDGEPAG
jgi:hypothetical protein